MDYQHIFIFSLLCWNFCNGSANILQMNTTCSLESVTDDLKYLIRKTNEALQCAEDVIRQLSNQTEEGPSCPKGLTNLVGSPTHQCIKCLSYVQFEHNDLLTFAQISVTKEYWRKAGSPSTKPDMEEDAAYKTCVVNENCILHTIKNYTEAPRAKDCNKDGIIDCKDTFFVHMYGQKCQIKKNAFNYGYINRLNACLNV